MLAVGQTFVAVEAVNSGEPVGVGFTVLVIPLLVAEQLLALVTITSTI